jgi:hypothetical protein
VEADVGRLARHSLGSRITQVCRWNARGGPQANGFNPDGTPVYDDRCEFAGGPQGRTFGLPCGPQGFDEQGRPCQEKLKIPRTWEYTAGAEREVIQGFALAGDVVYREYTNPYSTKETNRIWTESGGALAPTGAWRNGRAGEIVEDLETPSEARRKYLGVTVGAAKREGALKMNASYTWARLEGNVLNTEVNTWGDIPPRDPFLWGYLPDDARHTAKATLVYSWTRWLNTGVTYRYYSGSPYTRWFRNAETGSAADLRAPVGINPGNNLNDPGDDRELRLPDQHQLNLQVRSRLKPLIKQDIELFADIMNAMALRTTTSVYEEDGPLFGAPRDRMRPMRIRLGFRYRY